MPGPAPRRAPVRRLRAAAIAVALLGLAAGSPTAARAHGLYLSRTEGRAVTLHAGYSTGAPVAYGEVMVFAPDDTATEFQNGRTDRNGDFAFLPDAPGPWRITVDAGMGHRVRLDLAIGADAAKLPPAPPPNTGPLRILLGLSLLANLGLAAAWRKASSKPKHAS